MFGGSGSSDKRYSSGACSCSHQVTSCSHLHGGPSISRVGTATHATGEGVSEWCWCKHERCWFIRPLHAHDSGIHRRSTRTCLILTGRLPGIPIWRGWWEASLGGHARRETRSRGAHMPFVSLLDTSDTLTTPARAKTKLINQTLTDKIIESRQGSGWTTRLRRG